MVHRHSAHRATTGEKQALRKQPEMETTAILVALGGSLKTGEKNKQRSQVESNREN